MNVSLKPFLLLAAKERLAPASRWLCISMIISWWSLSGYPGARSLELSLVGGVSSSFLILTSVIVMVLYCLSLATLKYARFTKPLCHIARLFHDDMNSLLFFLLGASFVIRVKYSPEQQIQLSGKSDPVLWNNIFIILFFLVLTAVIIPAIITRNSRQAQSLKYYA